MNTKGNSIIPSDDAYVEWQEEILFSSGINFTLDVIVCAYFFMIGYKTAKLVAANPTRNDGECVIESLNAFCDEKHGWKDGSEEILDAETINEMIDRCCMLQFNMRYPKKDSPEDYKKKFNAVVEKYSKNLEKLLSDNNG